jgi:hypothetical protein
MADMQKCEKCGRTKDVKHFYKYRDGRPAELCKDCLTMHIDNFDPSTYEWVIKKLDLPYIPEKWVELRNKQFEAKRQKGECLNGMSVIGKYISAMKLKQFKEYGWEDSEKAREKFVGKAAASVQEMNENFSEEQKQFLKDQLDSGEISEAEYRTLMPVEIQQDELQLIDPVTLAGGAEQMYSSDADIAELDIPDPSAELTKEDKQYLAIKWGMHYRPNEWVELEKSYMDMMESFDIQDADTKNTLIFLCKTKLKMNQAIDCGDIDGFNKLQRSYDALRKSSNFNAASNKDNKGSDYIDSVGMLVAYCEKEGGKIPRFDLSISKDIVDKDIADLKRYTKNLVYEDSALAQEIETYLKKREIMEKMKEEKEEERARGNEETELQAEDYKEYYDKIASDREDDLRLQQGADGEEEDNGTE